MKNEKEIIGVLCAGGRGTRLKNTLIRDVSNGSADNKHALDIAGAPMVWYPLYSLITAGVEKTMVVIGTEHTGEIAELIGDGRIKDRKGNLIMDAGHVVMAAQREEKYKGKKLYGISQAIYMAKRFAKNSPVMAILGDNIIEGSFKKYIRDFKKKPDSAHIFLKKVKEPSHYGVAEIDKKGNVLSLEEKPKKPKSNLAVIGVYLLPSDVFEVIENIEPNPRKDDKGNIDHYELEITQGVLTEYLKQERLKAHTIKGEWFDAGASQEQLDKVRSQVWDKSINKKLLKEK